MQKKFKSLSKNSAGRILINFIFLIFALVIACAAAIYFIKNQLEKPLIVNEDIEVNIPKGTSLKAAANIIAPYSTLYTINPDFARKALYLYYKYKINNSNIKVGVYEINKSDTANSFLYKLIRGEQILEKITFIEGKTFKQIQEAISKAPNLKITTSNLSPKEIMEKIGVNNMEAEGLLFPSTYTYKRGATDLDIYKMAYHAMNRKLDTAWENRNHLSPLKNKYELLILASIIEKETGHENDRLLVAGVFVNRLNIGMRLQTDPTVIYGLGDNFNGRLRRKHLDTDTPFNTYTRHGLPPTPIAMPSEASLLAAANPANTKALYFVARGDGTSQFSNNLSEHNQAVNTFILKKGNSNAK